MTHELVMGLLPEHKMNYRSLAAGFLLQGVLLAIFVRFGFVQPARLAITARNIIVTHLVLQSDEPVVTPKVHVRTYVPSASPKIVLAHNAAAPPTEITETPPLAEPLAITKIPALPQQLIPERPSPVIQGNSFFSSATRRAINRPLKTAEVQTAGFGDPNGVKGHGDTRNHVTMASMGAFDLPFGAGRGNGRRGAQGLAGVGVTSGFGDASTSAATYRRDSADHSTLTTPIEILSKPKPDYSEEGRQLGLEGQVQLEVLFTASGQAHAVKVIRGLGHGLDEQAMRAAEQIKFRPAMHEGQPVDSIAIVHIIFEFAS